MELMNAKVKKHVEYVNIIHQFVRKLNMLSSIQMKEAHELHIQ